MKRFTPSSRIPLLPMLLSAILAAGLSAQVASQTQTDPAAGIWKMTKVVSVDACNACVQVKGCDRKNTDCTGACSTKSVSYTHLAQSQVAARCLRRGCACHFRAGGCPVRRPPATGASRTPHASPAVLGSRCRACRCRHASRGPQSGVRRARGDCQSAER